MPQAALDRVWHEPVQRARALDGLVADGLVEPLPGRAVPAAATDAGRHSAASHSRREPLTPAVHNRPASAVYPPTPYLFRYTTDGQPCARRRLLRTAP